MRYFYGLTLIIDEHLAELQFASPETNNAFDHEMHLSFPAALRHVRSLPDVRCLVLSAQGKTFSAGGDFDYIEGLARNEEQRRDIFEIAHAVYSTLAEMPIPIVAAMHGDAMGLGATVVTASDIIVTHPGARLADPHVCVGLCAGDGGVASWTLAVGITRAKRHLLTGEPLTGQQAYDLGLVTDLVADAESVLDTARQIAQRIAELPPRAVQGTKMAFNALTRDVGRTAFELSLAHEVRCLETADLREAIAAAKEKRKGEYRGY